MKACTQCKKPYDISHFVSLQNGKETMHCKTCRIKDIKRARNPSSKRFKLNQLYQKIKSELPPCELCGDDDIEHKEFDHIDPVTKIREVTNMTSFELMRAEAAKCRSLCKKCHRKQTTSIQRKLRRTENLMSSHKLINRNRNHINSVKMRIGGCQHPGCTDIFDEHILSFYEFDHINFTQKTANAAHLSDKGYSIANIDKELAKCELVCGYCHKKRTTELRKQKVIYFLQFTSPIRVPDKKKLSRKPELSMQSVIQIRALWNSGKYLMTEIADQFNRNRLAISLIVNNKTYFDPKYVKHHQRTINYKKRKRNSD